MKIIQLNINKQNAFLDEVEDFVVEGALNYVKLRLNFLSNDWKQCDSVKCIFLSSNDLRYVASMDENYEILVPSEALVGAVLDFSFVGFKGTETIITTKVVKLNVEFTNKVFSSDEAPNTIQMLERSIWNVELDNDNLVFTRNDKTDFRIEIPSKIEFGLVEGTAFEGNKGKEILDLIPMEATPSNQLADKEYVDNEIAKNGAHKVSKQDGSNYATYEDLTSQSAYYIAGVEHSLDANDYAIVNNYNDQPARFSWNVNWTFDYYLNELSPEQQEALNSGVSATWKLNVDTHLGEVDNKLDEIDSELNVVKDRSYETETVETIGDVVVPRPTDTQFVSMLNDLNNGLPVIISYGDIQLQANGCKQEFGNEVMYFAYGDECFVRYELDESENVLISIRPIGEGSNVKINGVEVPDNDIPAVETQSGVAQELEIGEGLIVENGKLNVNVSGAKVIEVGSGQASFFDKIFPQITKAKATEIYDTYTSGTPVIMRWTVMGAIPVEATVKGSDYINGVKSFSVDIHDTYSVEYSYSSSTGTIADMNVHSLGGESSATVRLNGSTQVLTMEANVCYMCNTEMSVLSISGFNKNNIGSPLWEIKFKTGTSFTATFPNTMNWVNGTPEFDAGVEYAIYIEECIEEGHYDAFVVEK